MTTLRQPELDQKHKQISVWSVLAPPWTTQSPFMWIWGARSLTASGSWLDDWKSSEHGGHLWPS